MPTYEYKCRKCGSTFERTLSYAKHKRVPKCPGCGSAKVEQLICSFLALTGKKA
ncbi:MAG: FmdB family zinc ribbon protein [Planctomycetota bacterium]